MCRLAGFTDTRVSQKYNKRAILTAMRNALLDGGPDASQVWMAGPMAMAHTRLAIQDLSDRASQPMERGHHVLAWNGELYNFRELRAELTAEGFTFESDGDTEVALQAFRRWGEDAVVRFRGMFAFALWDTQTHTLLLGRDPLGIKPMYWYCRDGLFLFGSQLRAFLQHPDFDRQIDSDAVAHFLRQGYIHSPLSIFRHTRKLQPGSLLRWRTSDVRPEEWRYMQPEAWGYEQPTFQGSEQEALEELDSRLREGIESQLVSDVPVGAFLSGGIDSSLLVSIFQKLSGKPVPTYTIGFEQAAWNEAPHARAIASYLGTDHHELTCTEADFSALLSVYSDVYDEPFGDSSGIPSLLLSRMVGRELKVALGADGADELFGGYAKYRAVHNTYPAVRRLGMPGRGALALLGRFDPDVVARWARVIPASRRPTNLAVKFEKAVRALGAANWQDSFHEASSVAGRAQVMALCGQLPERLAPLPPPASDRRLAALSLIDLHTYLEGDILVKMDRASMSQGLEVRVPFLDTNLVSFALALPDHFKIHGGRPKYLLRRLLDRYVPPALTHRPKQGFALPLADWLHTTLRPALEDMVHRTEVQEALGIDAAPMRKLIDHFLTNRPSADAALVWHLYILHAWHDRWMDNAHA